MNQLIFKSYAGIKSLLDMALIYLIFTTVTQDPYNDVKNDLQRPLKLEWKLSQWPMLLATVKTKFAPSKNTLHVLLQLNLILTSCTYLSPFSLYQYSSISEVIWSKSGNWHISPWCDKDNISPVDAEILVVEACSESSQTSKAELFVKIVNDFRPLSPVNYFHKKLHLRCLTGFWIHLSWILVNPIKKYLRKGLGFTKSFLRK